MLPANRFSTTAIVADFLAGDDLPRSKLQDFERGGIDIGDPSEGLAYQTWELRAIGREVRVRPYPDGTYTTLFTWDGIQEVAFAFDQNMQPIVAFKADNLWRLRWFNPEPGVNGYTYTSLPGVRDVRMTLDEKRELVRDFSDVLVFYLKDNPTIQPQAVYMRLQRDRYEIEYRIGNLPTGANVLDKVGMSKNLRIRFALFGLFAQPSFPQRPIAPFPPEAEATNPLVLDFRKARKDYVPESMYHVLPFVFELYVPPVSDTLP